jgi:hypothetical protein
MRWGFHKARRSGIPLSTPDASIWGPIDLCLVMKFYVRVFVNKDDADTRTSVDDQHFIGTFGALDSHANHGGDGNATIIFRVPVSRSVSNFYKVAPPGVPFNLRLVPVGAPKDFNFTVKKVSLKVD